MTRAGPTTAPTPGGQPPDRCRAGHPARQALDRAARIGSAGTGVPRGPPLPRWCCGPVGRRPWLGVDPCGGGRHPVVPGRSGSVAVAVAVVIAHVVLVPRGWSARLLAIDASRARRPHLLWHLPVALADVHRRERRAHRAAGHRVVHARCLVTLAVASLSYVLVERPIRTGCSVQPTAGRQRCRGRSLESPPSQLLVVVTTAVPPRLAQAGSTLPGQLGTQDGIDAVGVPRTSALPPRRRQQGTCRQPTPDRILPRQGTSTHWLAARP